MAAQGEHPSRGSNRSGQRSGGSVKPARRSAPPSNGLDRWLEHAREALRSEIEAVIDPLCRHLAEDDIRDKAAQEALQRVDSMLVRLIDTLVRLEEARIAAKVKIWIAAIGLLGAALGYGGSELLSWLRSLAGP